MKETQKPYQLSFSSDSWSFSGNGTNPLDTIKKLWADVTGENKTVREIIREELHSEVQKRTRNAIKRVMSSKELSNFASGIIKEEIERMKKEAS